MFRYLGFAWDHSSPQQTDAVESLSRRLRARSSQWGEVLNANSVRIFSADSRAGSLEPHLLSDNGGVVLGGLFERSQDTTDEAFSRKVTLDATRSQAIVSSQGRWLIDHCWGNYVAILVDRGARRVSIIKDPTGTLPCFVTSFGGVAIVFSCIVDCVSLGIPFTVNSSYLRSRTASAGGMPEQDSLNEVKQVYRGECIEIDPALTPPIVSRQFHWNPLTFSEPDNSLEDNDQAARAIRATVRSCTHTWAGDHDSLLLRLSGGLDSSIVLGCLKDAPTHPRVACYTYYNPRGRSDERPWARLAAQRAAVERLEYAVSPTDIDLELALRMEPAVEPVAAMGYLQRATIEDRLSADREASAVFTGDGGDSGFGSDSLVYAVPEYLRRHAVTPETLRLASRVALLRDQSTWQVLLQSLRTWMLGSPMSDQRQARLMSSRLVNPALRNTLPLQDRYPHPWFNQRKRIPWTTIRRVGILVCTPEFYNAGNSAGLAPEIISPLYSQPVVELLLRIPSYTLFEGGRDRGLARRAFVEEVPPQILQRLWKDRAPGFYDELIIVNREFLREALLDGILVDQGLLDRPAVEEALSATPSKSAVLPGEIFRHLDMEIWARQWMRRA